MSEAFRPLARTRLYEQVVARLREHVTAAGLRAGDRLPSERELSDRFGVSRASVRQAIAALEVQGVVEVRHGGGTYLRRDTVETEPVDELLDRQRRLPDVLDAREALETKLAELAAQRRSADDLVAIDAALGRMRTEIEEGDFGLDGDRRFHAAVTAAAHSDLLAEFMRRLDDDIAESRAESLRQPDRPQRSLAQHERIAEAIRAQQARAAATAMRRHLRTVSRVRLLEWDPEQSDASEAGDPEQAGDPE
ncbi:FadR/GntR family transcriptional regulator [Salinifilum aidingensis]